ncbi:class I poly(R)-hydroxyalkanoic acid synthase [Aureimonas frigidaquae]|uniref:class I poly(R)-hydroxyalkanoic acid synthase n=1 Tax=Aureimonas frigidaquae TaxID=424757 RepID=UPI0009FA60BA|nr:class I poly(R)-hydroxyalkanoic acid synthase [Aureimonas frigidaquae]
MADATDKTQDGAQAWTVRDPEAFALNMARAVEQAGKAASAWLAPREGGTLNDPTPAIYEEAVSSLSEVAAYWLSEPSRAFEAQTRLMAGFFGLWAQSAQRLAGDDTPAAHDPLERDKRFSDPEWRQHLFFDFLRRAYGLTGSWARDLVTRAEGLDPQTQARARFYLNQLLNAASPSNFVGTNPELYRQTLQENGENLVRGMTMLAQDVARGKGTLRLRQTASADFAVGQNLAQTEGAVIAQNALCQIIQYAPKTPTVFRRPILIVPPWINRYYILDLNPEKSFIRWMVEQGHTVFVISWVNPDASHADKDWLAYIEDGILFGLDTVRAATGEDSVNAIGYCVGGTLLSATLALLRRRGRDGIATATLLATQVDFAEAGELQVFVDEKQIAAIDATMSGTGTLDGGLMATAFNLLRSQELIWPYIVSNYIKGTEPPPFDLLYWNSDATRMTRANHLFYLRNCYLENRLSQGRMELDGAPVDLSLVDIPIYSLAAREDHIAPARSVYTGTLAFGAPVSFVVAGSGHIAGVVNPPARGKYQFWTGEAPAAGTRFDDWLGAAQEHPGSWWPHWQDWIAGHAGERVDARAPGIDGAVLEPAPGRYVRGA